MKQSERHIVIVNQAVNYLTVGFCNAFQEQFKKVTLVTGNIHEQGEALHPEIEICYINKWSEVSAKKKMLSYLKACWNIYRILRFRFPKADVFFVSLPPMGYLLNLILPNRFSMVIWDVYPDVFKISGMKETHPMYRIWSGLNKRSFRKAFRLFTIGENMAGLISQYVNKEKITILPIWSIFEENQRVKKENNPFIREHHLEGKFVVQYSGNIGLTHNVEVVVHIAEMLKEEEDICFQIIGRGSRVPLLKKMVEEKNLPNCQFLPFQSDEMFPFSLSAADLGVVILDEKASRGSVPSKSYNLMSYGIPALYVASVDSELKIYADKFRHAECYTAGNLEHAAQFILNLKNDTTLWGEYSINAERASENFKRPNADAFVQAYLDSTK